MRRLLASLLLLALGIAAHEGRLAFIRSWFRPGPPRAPARLAAPRTGPLHPVRVLLVDGLGEATADRLPALSRLCNEGLRLRVDAGFPSVSLPVQHVLWTGAWQNESGVEFAVAQLRRPALESLPELVTRRSGSAIAIAESHREVAASFPFSHVVAPRAGARPQAALELQQEVLVEAQSSAPLVFVHTLAVDEAGHRGGALSPGYREAALRSDELLAALLQVRQPEWTLLVLADHGHLAGGGHGDLEDEVRFVRACVAGPGLPAGRSATATMPDLTALIADRLGIERPAACAGRSLADLLAGAPPPLQAGPGMLGLRLLLALLAAGAGLALALRAARAVLTSRGEDHARTASPPARILLALSPLGLALGALSLLALGPPSLSRGYVYPALSLPLLATGLAVALLVALQLWTARDLGAPRAPSLLLLGVGLLTPALLLVALAGWPVRLPPLVPYVSAWASALLELAACGLVGLALAGVLIGEERPAAR